MITVRFRGDGTQLTGFAIRGHAGWADAGQDIVCAAVSSAAIMTANTLTEISAIPCEVSSQDGSLSVLLASQDAPRAQDLLRGFSLHMRELSRKYPNHIKVIYGGKHHA